MIPQKVMDGILAVIPSKIAAKAGFTKFLECCIFELILKSEKFKIPRCYQLDGRQAAGFFFLSDPSNYRARKRQVSFKLDKVGE